MQVEIEKRIIGKLLLPGTPKERKIDVICNLNEDLFLDAKYKDFLKSINKLLLEDKNPDNVLLYQTFQGKYQVLDIYNLTENLSSFEGIEFDIEILKENKYKRELNSVIDKYQKEIKSGSFVKDIDELKDNLIADLTSLTIDEKSEFIKISEYTDKIKEQLGTNKSIEGYSWGLNKLDVWTSGIVQPRLYIIGGLKKSGKTRFVIYLLTVLHNAEIQTAFLSMEMPGYEITKLLHASFMGMNDLRLRGGSSLTTEEKYLFENTVINEILFGIECKSGLNLPQVLKRIKRYAKMGYKVIFIDYLQRIKHNRNNSANELEEISNSIADAARQNNVAIILLSQLNATAENPREVPNMGSLKGSGGIGEAGDCILLFDNLYRRTKNENEKNQIDIYIEQRYGDSGKHSIKADLGSCKFYEI